MSFGLPALGKTGAATPTTLSQFTNPKWRLRSQLWSQSSRMATEAWSWPPQVPCASARPSFFRQPRLRHAPPSSRMPASGGCNGGKAIVTELQACPNTRSTASAQTQLVNLHMQKMSRVKPCEVQRRGGDAMHCHTLDDWGAGTPRLRGPPRLRVRGEPITRGHKHLRKVSATGQMLHNRRLLAAPAALGINAQKRNTWTSEATAQSGGLRTRNARQIGTTAVRISDN